MATNPIFRLTTATHNWDVQHTTTGQHLDNNYDGATKVRTTTAGAVGVGGVTTIAAYMHTPASTASLANLILTPGVAFTGANNGAVWYEATGNRPRIQKGSIATDFLTLYDNYLLAGGTANYMLEKNQYGDVSAVNEIIEQYVFDSDVITAITGATYTSNRATITPASSKVFKAGQIYDDGTYTYLALADNSVRRW